MPVTQDLSEWKSRAQDYYRKPVEGAGVRDNWTHLSIDAQSDACYAMLDQSVIVYLQAKANAVQSIARRNRGAGKTFVSRPVPATETAAIWQERSKLPLSNWIGNERHQKSNIGTGLMHIGDVLIHEFGHVLNLIRDEFSEVGGARFRKFGEYYLSIKGQDTPILNASTLTDPEKLLDAFGSPNLPHPARRQLALFAEPLRFDEHQQPKLVTHLWKYVRDHRASNDPDELVALGAAIRKLIAYLPCGEFDQLAEVLQFSKGPAISLEVELEIAKGLAYRLDWDSRPTASDCPRLCAAVYEIADYYSSRRALEREGASSIAVNAIIALALLKDPRVLELAQTLPSRSLAWFISLIGSRAKRLRSRFMSEQRRNADAIGLLPELIDVLPNAVER